MFYHTELKRMFLTKKKKKKSNRQEDQWWAEAKVIPIKGG